MKIISHKSGSDPYRPGVDVVYADGFKANLRVDYDLWIKKDLPELKKAGKA
jgi:hypothetical protein